MFKKIMLTLDGSDFSTQALPHAEAIADRFGCELVLYTSVENPTPKARALPLMDADISALSEGIERHKQAWADRAAQEMAALAGRLALSAEQVKLQVDAGVNPSDSIVTYARKHDIDLIVMTTHGRGGLHRQLRGSVADLVLQHAPCPVLLVRAVEKK